ncbi:MAG: ABC transporter ATP-binding protein, partial [Chloroflexi bacterium]|nr:ABC transporter ATP-binding protein [Chloroflexota bacterium]
MRILLRELRYLQKYWRRVAVAYFCLLGASALTMSTPLIIKQAVDVGVIQRNMGVLLWAGAAILLLAVFRGAFSFGQQYLGEYLSQAVAYDLRNALYERLQSLSYAYHDKQQTGQLMSRVTADVEAVRMFTNMGTLRTVSTIMQVLVSGVLMATLDLTLTLLVFSLLPLVAYRALMTSAKLRPVWSRAQAQLAQLGTILQENLTGIRVVKSFVREPQESAKFRAQSQKLFDTNYTASRMQGFNSAFVSFVLAGITAGILWVGGREVASGNLSVGGLIAFNTYLVTLAWPIRTVGWMSNIIARAISSGERIFSILDTESAVQEKPDAATL